MENFTAIRNGLDDHLQDGKFTPYDLGVYCIMLRGCDWQTGVWKGSAAKIVAAFGFAANLRDVQRSMHRLRDVRMINYRTGREDNRGKRGNYKVLLHHYKPQTGIYFGKRLDAFAVSSLEHPIYDTCVVSDVLTDVVCDVVSASIQDKRLKIKDCKIKGVTSSRSRATQLPESFCPKDSHMTLSAELGVDLTAATAAFTDYHLSKGSTFKDWDKALNTWLRRESKFSNMTKGNINHANRAEQRQADTVQAVRDAIAAERKTDEGMVH